MYHLKSFAGEHFRRLFSLKITYKPAIYLNFGLPNSSAYYFSKQFSKCSFHCKYANKWLITTKQDNRINLPSLLQRGYASRVTNANTNVVKDTILYKFDNPRYYKALNFFALSQFIFWSYLGTFAYTSLRDAPVDPQEAEKLPWYKRINMGESKFRIGLTVLCGIMGNAILGTSVWYTTRSIRYLVLRKGGQEISLVTYTPLGGNRIFNVPVTHISAQMARETARTLLPIKVHKTPLFYILDMKGEFKNPALFDATAGLYRNFDILKKR